MANIAKEIKNTFQSLKTSAKSMDEEETMVNQENTRKIEKERASAHDRMIEGAKPPSYGRKSNNAPQMGKNLNTVTQDSRQIKSILVNDSSTVHVMEPKNKNDAYLIIAELRNRQAVMVKLGALEQNEKKSILDTIYGACSYANLTVEQIDTQMILIDPSFKPNQR